MTKLTVFIQGSDNTLLEEMYERLTKAREEVLAETGLSELSIFHGNMYFCLLVLAANRGDYPVLVVLEQSAYSKAEVLSEIKEAGASDVYSYASNGAAEVVERVRKCVLSFVSAAQ